MILHNMSASLKLVFLLPVLLFSVILGQAQGNGRISGSVTSRSTLQPLLGISIVLSPGGKSNISDSLGNFRITGINPGTYSLALSGIGFQSKSLPNLVITTAAIMRVLAFAAMSTITGITSAAN